MTKMKKSKKPVAKKRTSCVKPSAPIEAVMATHEFPKKKGWGLFIISCIVGIALLGSVPLFTWSLDTVYSNKILPGVTLGKNVAISGLTREELTTLLNEYKKYLDEQGILFETPQGIKKILPSAITLNPDIPLDQLPPFIDIDETHTFERAYSIGRTGSQLEQLLGRIGLFFEKTYIEPVFTLDEDALQATLKKEFISFQKEPQDARFELGEDTKDIRIVEDHTGYGVDIEKIVEEIKEQLRTLQYPRVSLRLASLEPSITKTDASFLKDAVYTLVNKKPFDIAAGKKTFELTKKNILEWAEIEKISGTLPRLVANTEAIGEYLTSTIAPEVEVVTKDVKYEIQDGKVVTFQAAQDGKELDIEASIQKIRAALFSANDTPLVELPLVETHAQAPTIDGSELTIKEIIGRAETSFAGSPPNRLYNIGVGVNKINGLIIPNGEPFSLIQALGEIDAKSGFKPELVIKGSKTTPEYGGGLCQVSTTLFRAVAYGGLPILERRNHSFRVGYYEPPVGFDATIYFPKPDFRFLNDTGYSILIQARVEGTKIKMELWGVRDGRKVEVDTPTVFNIKKAGPTKIIETTDLAPGKKKCTEKAHNGADAIFERRVTYPDGELKKDIFKSHYVVWPAVCLIGKAPEPVMPEGSTEDGSSTQSLLPSGTVPITSPSEATTTSNEKPLE
ncbi:VanW family protein [Candidatus Uhrbacteria bacterium]|nr:VanW family protein [Candidatus Uhrbacteria bacterium]